jgi:hypothetical protein
VTETLNRNINNLHSDISGHVCLNFDVYFTVFHHLAAHQCFKSAITAVHLDG